VRLDAERWLRDLPAQLGPQRDVITGLLNEARKDARIRLLVVGCSIGRGAADALSDVDALYGVAESDWDKAIRESAGLVRRVAPLIDLYQATLPPASPDAHAYQHTFAQYANGVQIDLVVTVAREQQAPRPDWVVLYDPDERVGEAAKIEAPSEDRVRGWVYACLIHLSACAKYLTRGSLWEARTQIDLARTDLWRVWAVAQHVPDPQYGLTAILDARDPQLPSRIEATIAPLARGPMRSAALACLDTLEETWPRAAKAILAEEVATPPLAAQVRAQLVVVAT
jgi:hypothetical protein